jgi:hypothetical protein
VDDYNSSSIIKDIGRSYVVSSVLPAALFATSGVFIFRGFIPYLLTARLAPNDPYFISLWFILLAFIGWIAYCLFSITDWTTRLYEGYFFPTVLKSISLYFLKKWYSKITQKIRFFEKVRRDGVQPDCEFYRESYRAAKAEYSNLERVAPLEEKQLLPTRFGNIMFAFEQYSEDKYKIDGFTFFTRLQQVLPKQLMDQIEEKNNQMLFLLNSSLLAYIIGAFALLVGLIRLPCQLWSQIAICNTGKPPSNFFESGFVYFSPTKYMIIGGLFFVVGYVIYRLVWPVTESFGLLMRSGFDLYRFDLLRQMNIQVPTNLVNEMGKWEQLSEYMSAGDRLARNPDIPMELNYFVRENLAKGVDLEEQAQEKSNRAQNS